MMVLGIFDRRIDKARDDRTPHGFTLVELLVVIAIISILAAMLLPALEEARYLALKTAEANAMRQMTMGWMHVAEDRRGELVPGTHEAGFQPHVFFFSGFDLEPYAEQYGFIAATANPVMGTPPWNDPGNTRAACYSPTNYHPGIAATAFASPLRLSEGTSRDAMLMTEMCLYSGYYYAVHDKDKSLLYEVDKNPSYLLWKTPDLSSIEGGQCSFYDGSQRFVRIDGFEFASYNPVMLARLRDP